jgi:hypothetical protein
MSGFYSTALQGLLERTIPAEAIFYVFGVNDDYTFDSSHATTDDIDGDLVILPSQELINVTMVNGVLDSDNPKWLKAGEGIAEGISLNLAGVVIVMVWESGNRLLAFIDSAIVGLPLTLTQVNVTAVINDSGWLKI